LSKKTYYTEVLIPIFTILSDSIAIILSFYISYWIRFHTPFQILFPAKSGIPVIEGYVLFAVITLPVWIITFQSNKMYRLNRNVFIFDEFFSIFKCVSIALIISIGIIFFFRGFPYSRIVFVIIWFVSSFGITIGRYFMLKLEKTFYNMNKGVKNVAIVGENEMAEKIYDKFSKEKFVGFNVLGFFSYNEINNSIGREKKYLGNINEIPSIVRKLGIQKIIISISSSEQEILFKLIKICEGVNIEFMFVPDFIELITSRLKIEEISGIPFMKIKSVPLNVWNTMEKRIFDVITSLLFIICFSPLYITLMILIKITSPGPLFYSQERVGIDGKKFNILKFRSMKVNAEKSGPQQVAKNDNRYTPIGYYLRKFSLDELPQFFNVLKGDMSIVGPRPEREFFINQMKDTINKYLERYRVKCGITGWAQVNGLRGPGTSMQARIDYDIYYIENWSLVFDMKIILKTIKESLFSKNAF
jgi:Undecaprenyl-phosphate glucose phosphotransferase